MAEGIRWREWGQEAFDQAAEQGKPVLLDISAVWCHWCHVMDDTTYSDPAVIAKLSRDFIPVRVDNDRRPDVNSRYNMGGWPTTAFLTPEGDILTGATYLPPDKMRHLLDRVAAYYREHGAEITAGPRGDAGREEGGDEDREEGGDEDREEGGDEDLAPGGDGGRVAGRDGGLDRDEVLSAIDEVAARMEEAYDPFHGGFGTAPKFPQVDALQLLLVLHLRGDRRVGHQIEDSAAGAGHGSGAGHKAIAGRGAIVGQEAVAGREAPERDYLEMVERTLRAMREGGLYDHVEGGFFRYSTTRDWSIPHYEKMLEDNAELLGLYARAARLTGDQGYLDTVQGVCGYVAGALRSEEGLFYGSQDADETYYQLDRREREARKAPRIDRTFYVGWNALAASGFLEAYLATRETRLRETALVALERVWATARLGDGLLGHYVDLKGAHGPVLLEDSAWLALALLDAYEVTGERSFLERALSLLASAREVFGRSAGANRRGDHVSEDGRTAFHDTAARGEVVGHLRYRRRGLAENSLFALALLRASDITGDEGLRTIAAGALAHFLGPHRRQGLLAAGYALALDWWAGPTAVATVAGPADDQRTRVLHFEAAAAVSAARANTKAKSVGVDPSVAADLPVPAVLVCADDRCLPPVRNPGKVAAALRLAAGRSGVGRPSVVLTRPEEIPDARQPPVV